MREQSEMKLTREQWREVFDTAVAFALPVLILGALLAAAVSSLFR